MIERWRDTYDVWKLATPPEHEGEDEVPCPECKGAGMILIGYEFADDGRRIDIIEDCDHCNCSGTVLGDST